MVIEDLFIGAALAVFVAMITWIEPGKEESPAITSEAHRQWVAEQCALTTDEATIEQCAKFLGAK